MMRIETYLNAMAECSWAVVYPASIWEDEIAPSNLLKARRQYNAFRARILTMFEEQERSLLQREVILRSTRVAINSLDINIFGTAYVSETGEPYPIRDELIYNITKAINNA